MKVERERSSEKITLKVGRIYHMFADNMRDFPKAEVMGVLSLLQRQVHKVDFLESKLELPKMKLEKR